MKKECPKVYLYCDNWQNGGVEAYLVGLLRNWDLTRMDCTVLCAQKSTDRYDRELAELGVPLVRLVEKEKPGLVERMLGSRRAILGYLREHPAQAIYFNFSNAFTISYCCQAKKAGTPVRVVHSHSTQTNRGAAYPIKMAAQLVGKHCFAPSATALFACSDEAADWMFPQGLQERLGCRFVPNGIAVERFAFVREGRAAARQRLGDLDTFWLGSVGRLVAVKNQPFLLELMARLKDTLPHARLLLVGDGPEEAALKEKAKALGVEAQVCFYGPSRNVPELLWAMDAFLLPSFFEGLPVSVVEAQAAGLPCLISDRVTRQCAVTERAEFLPLEQPEAWAQAVSRLAQAGPLPDEARRQMAEQVREAGFDAADCARQVQQALEQMIKEQA